MVNLWKIFTNYHPKKCQWKVNDHLQFTVPILNHLYYMHTLLRTLTVHKITAGHRSLSGTISCVTHRIRFLPVTTTGRFSNFNSISYTEDRHELRVTGTKCRLPDTMSGTGEIFISGTAKRSFWCHTTVQYKSVSCDNV